MIYIFLKLIRDRSSEKAGLLDIICVRHRKTEWKAKNDLGQWFLTNGEIIFHLCFGCIYQVLQNSTLISFWSTEKKSVLQSSFGQDIVWILATIILIEIHVINNYFSFKSCCILVSFFFKYFSSIGTKEVSLNYLANILLFISGLCFGYCFAFVYLSRVTDDDIDSFFSEYLAKKNKKWTKLLLTNMSLFIRRIIINFLGMKGIWWATLITLSIGPWPWSIFC